MDVTPDDDNNESQPQQQEDEKKEQEQKQDSTLSHEEMVARAVAEAERKIQESDDGVPREPVMACDNCNFPIFVATDILVERLPTLQNEVYSYELDVLDRECACYSATNPTETRFDVVRVRDAGNGVVFVDCEMSPVLDHSWFPGFAWRMASCAACDAHLGWSFSAAPTVPPSSSSSSASAANSSVLEPSHAVSACESSDQQPSTEASVEQAEDVVSHVEGKSDIAFHGLILTRLKEAACTQEELHWFEEQLSWLQGNRTLNDFFMQKLRNMINLLPVSRAVQFTVAYHTMLSSPWLKRDLLLPTLADLANELKYAEQQPNEEEAKAMEPSNDGDAAEENDAEEAKAMEPSNDGDAAEESDAEVAEQHADEEQQEEEKEVEEEVQGDP